MLLNEAMLKQKSNYDRIVDKLGTEKEFGTDLGYFVLNDIIRTWQLFFIAMKYVSQNRQLYTAYVLIKNALESVFVFDRSFQCVNIKNSIDTIETKEYIEDALKQAKKIITENEDLITKDIDIDVDFDINAISCVLNFEKFYSDNAKTVLEKFFNSKESGFLREFFIEINENNIIISSLKKESVICQVYKNSIEIIYGLTSNGLSD